MTVTFVFMILKQVISHIPSLLKVITQILGTSQAKTGENLRIIVICRVFFYTLMS